MLLKFAGHTFEPLLSGALFWRAESMLLVADLHFEKFSSFAKRGLMLPPYDTGLTLKRIERDLEQTKAERVVSLGDSFHRDEGTETLLDSDRLRLMALLGDESLRTVATSKMEGYTTEEIADKMRCAPRTVERILKGYLAHRDGDETFLAFSRRHETEALKHMFDAETAE